MKHSFLLATLITRSAFTQTVTMEQANEPSIGNTKNMYECDTATNALEGVTGNGATWDFSQIVGTNSTKTIEIIDPATSSYSTAYPTSTKGFSIQGALTNFYNSTPNERISQGFVFNEPSFGTVVATFDTDEQKTVSYPFANGNSLTDAFSGSLAFTFNGVNQNPTCTGTSYASIDGQGTLLLPSGNAYPNVIRYKIVDTVFTQVSFVVPLDVIFVRTQYEYYDLTNDVLPLFTYSNVSIKQAGTAMQLAAQKAVLSSIQPTSTTGIQQIEKENFTIVPNPVSEAFTLAGIGNQTHFLTITDLSGRIIKTVKDVSEGHSVSSSDLPSGTYLIKLDHSEYSEKLIIE